VTVAGHWVLPLSYCACAPGASAVGTLSGRSRLIARPPLILATFVASALLAKYIRMRTARSAATASHPCVEHATEGIKKKNPAGVLPLSFLQSFFSKKRRSSRDIGAARHIVFLLLTFLFP